MQQLIWAVPLGGDGDGTMKVFISVDMEGVAGISDSVHTNPHGYDYQPARRLMTGEANAAVQGALIVGATEIWVSDSHGGNGYRSILGTELDEEAQLITGGPRPFGQLEGIDRFFDALLLVGYHARHGVFGVLNHTTNGLAIEAVHVNGIEVGEIGLNAGLAGHYGVPTVLVTGDDMAVAEGQALIPGIHGAVVKTALGRYASRGLHPSRARELIRLRTQEALKNRTQITPYSFAGPVQLQVRFKDTGPAENASTIPGMEWVDDSTLATTCPDFATAYRTYRTMVSLYIPAWGSWIRSTN